jgi:uncharacterized protein with PIN domain
MGVILDFLTGLPLNAVYRERITDFERKMTTLETENRELKAKIIVLEAENTKLKAKLQKIEESKTIQGDVCPYCQQPQGKLLDIRPDKFLGMVGVKIQYYECQGCGKKYDKEQRHS